MRPSNVLARRAPTNEVSSGTVTSTLRVRRRFVPPVVPFFLPSAGPSSIQRSSPLASDSSAGLEGRSRRGGGAGTGRVSFGTPPRRGAPGRPAPPLRDPAPLRDGPSERRPRGSSSSRRRGAPPRDGALLRDDPALLRPLGESSSRRRGPPVDPVRLPPAGPLRDDPPVRGGPPLREPPDDDPPREDSLPPGRPGPDGRPPREPAPPALPLRLVPGFEPPGRPDLEGPEPRPALPLPPFGPPRDGPEPRPDGDWGDIATSWLVRRRSNAPGRDSGGPHGTGSTPPRGEPSSAPVLISVENDLEGRSHDLPSSGEIRRRPTLPGTNVPSTIGAGGLNFRVRDGNGCDPSAMATEISCQLQSPPGRRLEDFIAITSMMECVIPKPSAD